MHFVTLILALFAAGAASAAAVENRNSYLYFPTFFDLHSATEAPDYLTFVLVPTIPDCFKECNEVKGCGFVNTYYDVKGEHGSPLLICSMYSSCHWANSTFIPFNSYIVHSYGWCKYSY